MKRSRRTPWSFAVSAVQQLEERILLVAEKPEINVSVAPLSVFEDGTTNMTYTFTRTDTADASGNSTLRSPLRVRIGVGGTAQPFGADYTFSGLRVLQDGSTDLNFPASVDTVQVTVDPRADQVVELNKTVVLSVLADANGADSYVVGRRGAATGRIVDDDRAVIAITDVSVVEGAAGTATNATFTLTMNRLVDAPVSVDYATVSGTATEGVDFTRAVGTVVFAAGATRQTITVEIRGDDIVEVTEQFGLRLSNLNARGRAVSLAREQATGTIRNDDAARVRLSDAQILEGAEGQTRSLSFEITLDRPVDRPLTFDAATANLTAVAGSDYMALSSAISIGAGITSRRVLIPVTGDNLVERDETLSLTLSNLQTSGRSVTVQRGRAIGTILNDDVARFSVSDAAVTEGPSGSTRFMTFSITLDQPVDTRVTVVATTEDRTATAGDDYGAVNRVISFPAGELSRMVTLPVFGDGVVEESEVFVLQLHTPNGFGRDVRLGRSQGAGVILDGDRAQMGISDATITEGPAGGTRFMVFTIGVSKPLANDLTILVSTSNGTATAGSDYRPLTNTTVTLSAGQQLATVAVAILGDSLEEADETFFVTITSVTGGTVEVLKPIGVGTILDDDRARGRLFASGIADLLL